ncbi:uncharacterized protein LOC128161171 isoform X1 [Crassostrea angulata]|uniref:uncharacterized protein LOC128161171 isoform X1 n=1 Tax=Magallana angulata TaxID=2784310 RepID=UPI0022B1AF00|nr:uncharacterized protein LOC128161171 isoform X1 [Crassostrea angulata]
MRDIVGQSLGVMSQGHRLNQSGIDHVSQGLSSPLHNFMVQSLLRNYMMNQWNVGNISIDTGNISLSNMTDLTLAEASEEDSSLLILVLSLILAGLIVASIVMTVILFKKDISSLTSNVFKLGSARKQPDEPEDQPGLWDEDDATLYSTIFLDDANLGVAKDNFVVDNTSSDCKSQSEYSRLKRNYGNRINSEENGSENPYDKLVLHTQTVNRLSVSSKSSDDHTPQCTPLSTVYVISEFPEVF